MRLKERDVTAIKNAARQVFGETAVVRLFGSRVDDDLRGGDIDLLIEADASTDAEWRRVSAFKEVLFEHIDEQKVDVVLVQRGVPPSAFARMVAPGSVLIP